MSETATIPVSSIEMSIMVAPSMLPALKEALPHVEWVAGDTKIVFDPENADEVANARSTFDTLKKKGFTAYHVTGSQGEPGEVMREFEPRSGKIIMRPQMKGG